MNLKELIAEFRTVTDDLTYPYFWSDAEIIGYANEAERQAARRALLLMDVETSELCRYTVLAGQALLRLDSRVIMVRRLRLIGQNRALAIRSWREVEELTPAWEQSVGDPVVAIPDWQTGAMRLAPIPTNDDSALVAVFRLPLVSMATSTDCPEINPSYHLTLVSSMLAQGYSKHDSETFDPEAAAFYEAQFTAAVGPAAGLPAETQATRDTSRTRHKAPR